jgi:hypothetical protein
VPGVVIVVEEKSLKSTDLNNNFSQLISNSQGLNDIIR